MSRTDAILNYQDADLERQQVDSAVRNTDARQRLGKLNRLLKSQQAVIAKLTEDIDGYSAQLKKLSSQYRAVLKRLELESSELETLNNDEECTSEELTEFRRDVEKLHREAQFVQRELQKLSESLEQAMTEYQAARQKGGKAKKEYDQVKEICQRERDEAAADLLACDKKMETLATKVEPALMKRYVRARQHHNQPVVPLRQGKCSGCNMSLPMLAIERLANDGMILECENCGRLLYVPEE